MSNPSPALRQKIARARAGATSDLPLVRSAARVVLVWASEEVGLDAATAELKATHGTNWSLTTALQLLSGRRGQFASECAPADERARLYVAHLVSKLVCSQAGLGAVSMPTRAELEGFRELASADMSATLPSASSGPSNVSPKPNNTSEAQMQEICVISDLDGTLVDSETLCNQAFIDLLPELGEAVEVLVARYRGKGLALILADLELRLGVPLTSDFEARYRNRVAELFALDLRPTVGSTEMLAAISFPYCLASSGPLTKIKHALQVSGLERFFGTRVFSSYEVGSWKPEPGLFLHAASAMGFSPERCVVVEDSEVGVEAAAAAGMRALRYAPQGEQDSRQCPSFSDMALLPALLRTMCDAPQCAQ